MRASCGGVRGPDGRTTNKWYHVDLNIKIDHESIFCNYIGDRRPMITMIINKAFIHVVGRGF